jgi:hypothetical protein
LAGIEWNTPDVDEEHVRDELEATVAARRELGPGHDRELVDSFLERIEKEIDRRIDERVAKLRPRGPSHSPLNPATLGVCIPIIAIAGGIGGVAGLAIVTVALVVIFAIATRQ